MDHSASGQGERDCGKKISGTTECKQEIVDFEAGSAQTVSASGSVNWVDFKSSNASPLIDALQGLLDVLNCELSSETARLDGLRKKVDFDV